MGAHHSSKAESIIWNITRTLIRDPSFVTDQVSIPSSDDTNFSIEWRHSADRCQTLHTHPTDHPDEQL